MEKTKLLEIALEEWIASLPSRDRSSGKIKSNFEDLFQTWKNLDATFEELYETLLKRAIKAHLPSSVIVQRCYKALKREVKKFDKTEKQFSDEWIKGIENVGLNTFLEFFPSPIKQKANNNFHGNMSAAEYRAQRKYADQFPILDTTELEERWRQRQYNLDVEDMIKNVLGETDEANSRTN